MSHPAAPVREMVGAGQDPREFITPEAFSVAPELLGTPLARPWRRAAAMAIDGIAIVIVGQLGGIFVGLAITFLLIRRAVRRRRPGELGVARVIAGVTGALALAGTLGGTWLSCFAADAELGRELTDAIVTTSLGEAGALARDGIAIVRADDEAELRQASQQFAASLQRQGVEPAEIRSALEELAAERSEPWARAAILSALTGVEAAREPSVDSLVIAYARALEAGDTAGAAALREPVVESLAADRVDRLEGQVAELRRESERLQEELDEERDRGLLAMLLGVADDVGLGIGWAGFYFTLFVAVWGGRTPGKRLLGIRIVRLDGKPIGWWIAFNRFGGYAASVFTGLLGFLEMLWDPNRQALHDRIAATVVVRGGTGGPRPTVRNPDRPPSRTEDPEARAIGSDASDEATR